ncbi:MAG TPA: arsenic resistance N-acetyltransferase ArsN2 [Vicinamibacterales bacterium]|nr:arsenic resistance N-acetyltransferase ArsN2 [Vicinamibacterales bacterium]
MIAAVISPAKALDIDVVEALLEREHLPLAGLRDHVEELLVARAGNRIVGCAALELYEDGALLRSLAVDAEHRGSGLGSDLTHAALLLADQRGMPAVYLLTTTAERFFPRFGFEVVDRADVPQGVQQSAEFSYACPSSALIMRKRL